MDRLDRMLALIRARVPELKIVHKADSRLMGIIAIALWPITPDFSTRFTTVLGKTVYIPRPMEEFPRDHLARVLAHEFVHQLDMMEHGAWFYGSYLVAPLPVVRTQRAIWERRAYGVDLLLAYDLGGEPELQRYLQYLIETFSGPSYAWMWAGTESARQFLEPLCEEVRSGELQKGEPYASIYRAWCEPKGGDETCST